MIAGEDARTKPEDSFLGEKYVLKRQIGQGGMGRVYLAIDRKLHKKWAVKELCHFKKSVEAELMVLKQADHRNLPRIVDVLHKGGKTYLVMDYIEGEPLNERLKRTGGLSVDEIIRCGQELSDVLCYLHQLEPPIIYRDMKPSNIILRKDGSAVLIDFGTAKLFAGGRQDTTALGTKEYAPPEQFLGKSDERSDIYALGVTLSECMPKDTRGFFGRRLRKILRKCTQNNPSGRYQTAEALKKDFDRLANRRESREGVFFPMGIALFVIAVTLFAGRAFVPKTSVQKEMPQLAGEPEEKSPQTEGDVLLQQKEQIQEMLKMENVSWEDLSTALAQLDEQNKVLSDQEERMENAVFLAGVYLSYENHLEGALKNAAVILRREEAAFYQEESRNNMEQKEECLLMLSTIFRLLGKKEPENKEAYYRKSVDYTEELFETSGVKEKNALYGQKIADTASMLEEIGEMEEARKYYLKWEKEFPGQNRDIYLRHLSNLFLTQASKEELEQLFHEAKKIEGMEDDERFRKMEKRFQMDYGDDYACTSDYGF